MVENDSSKSRAYHQVELNIQSKKMLVISTHIYHMQYKLLEFRVSSALAIWQYSTDHVLQNIPSTEFVLADIIVTGKDNNEHLQIHNQQDVD